MKRWKPLFLQIPKLEDQQCLVDIGDANKATAAALRARLMGLKQPSMVLGPTPPQDSDELRGPSARAQTVELSAVDSKGRAVPGAFGRAAAGAGAPDGGRKPKRVRYTMHSVSCLMHSTILVGQERKKWQITFGTAHQKLQLSQPHYLEHFLCFHCYLVTSGDGRNTCQFKLLVASSWRLALRYLYTMDITFCSCSCRCSCFFMAINTDSYCCH